MIYFFPTSAEIGIPFAIPFENADKSGLTPVFPWTLLSKYLKPQTTSSKI